MNRNRSTALERSVITYWVGALTGLLGEALLAETT